MPDDWNTPEAVPDEKPKRGKRKAAPETLGRAGCLKIGLSTVALVLLTSLGPMILSGMWFAPGDAARYDPIARYDDAAALAGGYDLVQLRAEYVRPDGTLDLWANYDPSVHYNFARQIEPPDGGKPLGAGTSSVGNYYERIFVRMEETEFFFTRTWHHWRDDDREVVRLAPPPRCAFAQLWDTARTRGAPAAAVAVIVYDADGYDFRIEGTPFTLEFDHDCQLKN